MKNQYAQYCNAAYLKSMGIKVLDNFTNSHPELTNWIHNSTALQIRFPDLTIEILENILKKHNDFSMTPNL